jgi:hypothetical protein
MHRQTVCKRYLLSRSRLRFSPAPGMLNATGRWRSGVDTLFLVSSRRRKPPTTTALPLLLRSSERRGRGRETEQPAELLLPARAPIRAASPASKAGPAPLTGHTPAPTMPLLHTRPLGHKEPLDLATVAEERALREGSSCRRMDRTARSEEGMRRSLSQPAMRLRPVTSWRGRSVGNMP